MQGHGKIARNRPRGCGPDNQEKLLSLQPWQILAYIGKKWKLHIDGWRGADFVFDFRFCKGCLASAAPVDRLFALKEASANGNFSKLPHNGNHIAAVHSQIRIFPLAHYTEPFKLFLLHPNISLGIRPALFSDLDLAHPLFLLTKLLVNLVLNGKAVAIPSRDIGNVKSVHLTRPDDYVL